MDSADGARLDQLEADISDVASALETVDRIVAETDDGESAAAEIAAVVSPERFRLESDGIVEAIEVETNGEAGSEEAEPLEAPVSHVGFPGSMA